MVAMAVYRNFFAGRTASTPEDDSRWLTAKQRSGVPHSQWSVDDWEHYYTAQRMRQEWLDRRRPGAHRSL
jgi:hypothetical protein